MVGKVASWLLMFFLELDGKTQARNLAERRLLRQARAMALESASCEGERERD